MILNMAETRHRPIYLSTRPSKKRIQRIIEAVHMHTSRNTALLGAAKSDEQAKSGAWRLGNLLSFGLSHQDIPLRQRLHQSSAAPMAL
jgi:hypothetical protein